MTFRPKLGWTMGFKKQETAPRIDAGRLAALAGKKGEGAAPASPAGAPPASDEPPRRRVSVEPDLSRINKNRLIETAEQRKKRLAAKSVNFSASFIARAAIIAAALWYGYGLYQSTGDIDRMVAVGVLVMAADFGRVLLKAMEPGSR